MLYASSATLLTFLVYVHVCLFVYLISKYTNSAKEFTRPTETEPLIRSNLRNICEGESDDGYDIV